LAINPLIFGTLGSNGWYTSNVTVNWKIDADPPYLESVGCDAKTLTADTPGIQLECRARNDPNNPNDWVSVKKTFKIDKTAPTIASAAARVPDWSGWYNRPVTVSFSGTDATSGIAPSSCSSVGYAGPDNPAAVVGGTCRDNAGNLASGSFALKYDATPPSLLAVTTKTGNRTAEVSWRMSSDTAVVEVFRAPGLNGQGETAIYRGTETGLRDKGLVPARKYEYRVAAIDQAMNRAESKVDITATGALFSPLPGAAVAAPPTLSWAPVKGAAYYNVLLMRGRKIFSAWPARTSFRLPRTWSYKGRRYKLRPGVYRWYVWPGFGRVTAGRYGRLLGGSTFVFRP
jgi:hypothetical protein